MEDEMVQLAITALGIDVPVMRYRVVGNRVELHLYGGVLVFWDGPEGEAVPAEKAPKAQPAKPPRKRGAQ